MSARRLFRDQAGPGARWARRSPWLLGAVGFATAATGFAATFPVASKSLTLPKTCVLTANPSTTTVESDSAVRQASATTKFGTATSANVTSSNNANIRSYIKFDLTKCSPAIPAAAAVKLATLRLYITAVPNACRTQDIFRVAASWTETGITWNNQPFGTAINNPAQGQRTAFIDVGSAPCANSAAGQYVSGWTVTTDVRNFVSGAQTNFGWMIRDDVENSGTARASAYSTKDDGTLARAPQLVITYFPT